MSTLNISQVLRRSKRHSKITNFCLLTLRYEKLSVARTTHVLSTSLGKMCFAWHFILNEIICSNWPYLIFSVSVFCYQICSLKLNLQPIFSLTYAITIVKWFFGFIYLFILFFFIFFFFFFLFFFFFFLLDLNYCCFTTILWKIQRNRTSETCWKSVSKLPTLQIPA